MDHWSNLPSIGGSNPLEHKINHDLVWGLHKTGGFSIFFLSGFGNTGPQLGRAIFSKNRL